MSDNDQSNAELNYYKKKVDELAGENLKLDYLISGLRHSFKQKQQGFALLSSLQQSIGLQQEVGAIFSTVISAINATLGMDKTIVLYPTGEREVYQPGLVLGTGLELEELCEKRISIKPEVAMRNETAVFNKATPVTEFSQEIKNLFDLPYFVMFPVKSDNRNLAVIISGRSREAKPLYPPLDDGDVDTFMAISGLISAVIEVMKVVALKETDRLKTEFFANISHEFRTPITLTIGPLEEIVNGNYGPVSEKIRAESSVMLKSQRRLLNLITQILDLAKLESGSMGLRVYAVRDLNGFLDSRLEQFHSLATKRGLALKRELDPSLADFAVYLDVEKFDKVIFNLLSNSIKFTKAGSITLRTTKVSSGVRISVIDTGIGIRPDQISSIFDRFKQADGSSTREYAGTGIGLSLVKEIVELHRGTLEVFSDYGKGTSFDIHIRSGFDHFPPESIHNDFSEHELSSFVASAPVDLREGTTVEEEKLIIDGLNTAALQNLKPRQPKVLYVDDNADLRRFVHGLLSTDFNIFLAVDGVDGLTKAKAFQVDIILSDLMMPVMNGAQFLEHVKADREFDGVPFVMLTSRGDLDTKIEHLRKGADDFLSKPFAESEIRARIANLLKIREQQVQIRRDLQAAKVIQRSLLPGYDHNFGGIEVQALYEPADMLSGDFFDIVEINGFVYFSVVDVTSHGTAAAQVTYLVKGILRNILQAHTLKVGVAALLEQIALEYKAYKLEYAIGIALCRMRVEDGHCEYVSSNLPNPFFISEAASNAFVPRINPIIHYSHSDTHSFVGSEFYLGKSESFFVFTDGCYEFISNSLQKEFGRRRLERLLMKLGENDWREVLLKKLIEELGHRNFEDDITILRIRRTH